MPCLTPDNLQDFLQDRLVDALRTQAEEHLSDCPTCRRRLVALYGTEATLAAVAELAEDLSPPPSPPPQVSAELLQRARDVGRRQRLKTSRRSYRPWAIAALVVLSAGIAGWQLERPQPISSIDNPDVLRNHGLAVDAFKALTPEEGAVVAVDDLILHWTPQQRAEDYTVTLLDGLGNILQQTTTEATHWPLSQTQGASLKTGSSYYWFVTVRLDDGSTLETVPRRFTFGRANTMSSQH